MKCLTFPLFLALLVAAGCLNVNPQSTADQRDGLIDDTGKATARWSFHQRIKDPTIALGQEVTIEMFASSSPGGDLTGNISVRAPDADSLDSQWWNFTIQGGATENATRRFVPTKMGCGFVFLNWTNDPVKSSVDHYCVAESESLLVDGIDFYTTFPHRDAPSINVSRGAMVPISFLLKAPHDGSATISVSTSPHFPVVEYVETTGEKGIAGVVRTTNSTEVSMPLRLYGNETRSSHDVKFLALQPGLYEIHFGVAIGGSSMHFSQSIQVS